MASQSSHLEVGLVQRLGPVLSELVREGLVEEQQHLGCHLSVNLKRRTIRWSEKIMLTKMKVLSLKMSLLIPKNGPSTT